jgi:hypothetical protein
VRADVAQDRGGEGVGEMATSVQVSGGTAQRLG